MSPVIATAPSRLEANEACQALANLCVLEDYSEASLACRLYEKLKNLAPSSAR